MARRLPEVLYAETRIPYYVPRPEPAPVPPADVCDPPVVCLIINREWAVHVRGVLDALAWPDTWIGTDAEVQRALDTVEEMQRALAMTCDIDLTEIERQLKRIADCKCGDTYAPSYQQLQQTIALNCNPTAVHPLAPEDYFDGNEEDTQETRDQRAEALCMAIDAYVNATLRGMAASYTAITGVATAVAAFATTAWAPLADIVIVVAGAVLVAYTDDLFGDEDAQKKVRCCFYNNLKGKELSEQNFKDALADCGFDFGTHEAQQAFLVHSNNQYPGNYNVFLRLLGEAWNSVGMGETSDDRCICAGCDSVPLRAADSSDGTQILEWVGQCEVELTGESSCRSGQGTNCWFAFWDTVDGSCWRVTAAEVVSGQISSQCTWYDCENHTGHAFGGNGIGELVGKCMDYLTIRSPERTTIRLTVEPCTGQ